jgi:hypothetical protein
VTAGPEIEFGYGYGQEFEVCAHVVGADAMVCGRQVGWITVTIEQAPADLHPCCRELLDAGLFAPPGPVCAVCGEEAPVEGGLVQPHGGCVGVNIPPRRRQS